VRWMGGTRERHASRERNDFQVGFVSGNNRKNRIGGEGTDFESHPTEKWEMQFIGGKQKELSPNVCEERVLTDGKPRKTSLFLRASTMGECNGPADHGEEKDHARKGRHSHLRKEKKTLREELSREGCTRSPKNKGINAGMAGKLCGRVRDSEFDNVLSSRWKRGMVSCGLPSRKTDVGQWLYEESTPKEKKKAESRKITKVSRE